MYNRFCRRAARLLPAGSLLPRLFSLLLAAVPALPAAAQDTLFYDNIFNPVTDTATAYFMEVRRCEPTDPNRCIVMNYLAHTGSLVSVMKYSNYAEYMLHGRCSYWYPNGTVCREATYKNGMLQGAESIYYPNGQLKRKLMWDQDTLVSGTFFNEDGTPKTEVYQEDMYSTEWRVPPAFPGGSDSLNLFFWRTIHYPPEARENNIQGTVLVSFVVERNGDVVDARVQEAVSPLLDKEALRLVRMMPRWLPARVNGIPVRVRYVFPVTFRLE